MAGARVGLPKSHRLLKPAEFKATLKSSLRWRNDNFSVHAALNPYPHGRLGIVVSRRTSPRAVIRNRIKRQVRESYRHYQAKLSSIDIVVVANTKAAATEMIDLRTSLQQLWEKVEQRCKES